MFSCCAVDKFDLSDLVPTTNFDRCTQSRKKHDLSLRHSTLINF